MRRGKVGAGLPSEPWKTGSANGPESGDYQNSDSNPGVGSDHVTSEGVTEQEDFNNSDAIVPGDYIVPDPEADAVESPLTHTTAPLFPDRRRAQSVQLDDILESEDENRFSVDSPSTSDSSFPESLPPLRPMSALRWFLDPNEGNVGFKTLNRVSYDMERDTKSFLGEIDPRHSTELHESSYPFFRNPLTFSDLEWRRGSRTLSSALGISNTTHHPFDGSTELGLISEPSTSFRSVRRAHQSWQSALPLNALTLKPSSHVTYASSRTGGGGSGQWSGGQEQDSSSGPRRMGVGGSHNFGRSNMQGGHGGDDGGDEGRRGRSRSAFSSTTNSDGESEEESDDEAKEIKPQTSNVHQRIYNHKSTYRRGSSTDDDVPLAEKIPTALSAQRSIRRQVRDEREARKRERDLNGEGRSFRNRETARSPPRTFDAAGQRIVESQDAMSSKHRRRSADAPFTAEDLTQKLLKVQASDRKLSPVSRLRPLTDNASSRENPSGLRTPNYRHAGRPAVQNLERLGNPPEATQRRDAKYRDGSQEFHSPAGSEPLLGRSTSGDRPRTRDGILKSRTTPGVVGAGYSNGKKSTISKSNEDHSRSSLKPNAESQTSRRTSTEMHRATSHMQVSQRQQIDSFTSAGSSNPPPKTTLQRVFIGDRERFNMVEIGPTTSAEDVLGVVSSQGSLENLGGTGGLMLWEVAQDCGMGKSSYNDSSPQSDGRTQNGQSGTMSTSQISWPLGTRRNLLIHL
jgi:hypothetical protein